MCILALALRERGALAHDTVVATVMSNLGMLQAMAREGVTVRQAGVGDRYVLEDMKAGGFSLGGEQSGHVIFLDHGTTGDGVLTGLHLCAEMARSRGTRCSWLDLWGWRRRASSIASTSGSRRRRGPRTTMTTRRHRRSLPLTPPSPRAPHQATARVAPRTRP